MSEKTTISYATYTWSPWIGCTAVSEGCKHCYAREMSERFGWGGFGAGVERHKTKDWKKPLSWNRLGHYRGRVFPSLCDWLDDEVPAEWLADFMQTISLTPNLNWLLLTKRPQNWRPRLEACLQHCQYQGNSHMVEDWLDDRNTPLSSFPRNIWFGITAENQAMLEQRGPIARGIPATVKWVSYEPLLEPIVTLENFPHWAVIGGESGRYHRNPNLNHRGNAIVDLAKSCKAHGNLVYVKQDAGRFPGMQGKIPDDIWQLKEIPEP